MAKDNYKVCRDDIYVGEVANTDSIYRYNGETSLFRTKPSQLSTGSWFHYRSMLFVPNEQKLANDLLYSSPNYPILNITDDDTCLSIKTDTIVVKDACNLAQILEYLKYNVELTIEDIIDIRKKLFTGNFAMDNCELFGWKEDQPEDWTYYENNQPITDRKLLKQRIAEAKAEQKAGSRSFSGSGEAILNREYFDVLYGLGGDIGELITLDDERINAFTPHKEEGPIKKLRRF